MPFNVFNSVARLKKNRGLSGVTDANWVAVGESSRFISKSLDGNNWTGAGSVTGIATNGFGVAYGKDGTGAGLWVAVGAGGLIAKSSDGNLWSAAGSKGGLSTYGLGVAYGKEEIV